MAFSETVNLLVGEASALYLKKEYDQAALKYGEACGEYSSSNDGEESIELLYLYGKCLFQSGVSKSEAFGGEGLNVGNAGEEEEEKEEGPVDSSNFQFNETLAEEEEEDEEEEAEERSVVQQEEESDSENEEVEANEGDEDNEGEEQSDFELLWDILDLTRTLIEDKISKLSKDEISGEVPLIPQGKEASSEYVKLLEKLSETYDLLGEVSLELENFPQASVDLAKALELREKLYPSTSQFISESHYKLSLALEFCVEDPESRSKAAKHMKLALEIVEKQPDKDEELIQDLKVRLVDLQKDPAAELQAEKERILKGILGEQTSEDIKKPASLDQKPAQINDLTGMVVKKKRKSDNKKIPGQKKQKI